MRLRIGIDVGGTNTDCVLLDPSLQHTPSRGIIACAKTLTTSDITTGIYTAIKQVLDESKVDRDNVAIVTVGTTHFLNAIIERDVSRLDRVAILRLSSSYSRSIPPFSDFPQDLKSVLYGYHAYVSGGLQIDGSLIGAVDESEIVKECAIIQSKGLKVVIIAGIYSPIDTSYEQEYAVKKIIKRELPDVKIVCSRDVGTVGFLERENSAILNGSILRFSEYVIQSFKNSLKELNLNSLLYLTQNDGTMISSDDVKETPIVTFSSGPTNSILGAAYLSQVQTNGRNIIVADIGGTTTDIGVLLPSGFPKQASAYLTIAGVRINYTMPHIHSIGLGGGSIVRQEGDTIHVGPDSVGYSLSKKAMIFGGDTLTTTDISTIAHGISFESSSITKLNLDVDVPKVVKKIHHILETAIDSIKTSQDDIPLLLVGGGSIIIHDDLKGISEVIKPKYHQHANAVGAAVSKVSHVIDTMITRDDSSSLKDIIEAKKTEVIQALVQQKNALLESCYIVDVMILPIQYSEGQVRIIIKAAGDIDFETLKTDSNAEKSKDETTFEFGSGVKSTEVKFEEEDVLVPALDYKPDIVNGNWDISLTDLKWISNGCYVLGCAGGGSPQCEYLEVRNLLQAGHKITLRKWDDIGDDEFVGWGGIMGSPTVSYERLGGTDTIDALTEIAEYTKTPIDAIMSLEIGGANGLQSLLMASSKYHNKPLIDCDWMGRAYPTYYQTTLATHTNGSKLCPAAISDGIGNSVVLTKSTTFMNSDLLLRAVCGELGSRVGYSGRPTEGSIVKKYAVKNTYSMAWRIGRQIAHCQENGCTNQTVDRIIKEVGGLNHAKKLFCGKIISVEQKLVKSTNFGEIIVQAFNNNEIETDETDEIIPYEATGGILKIPFKNEIIYAEHEHEGKTRTLASVPDLISIIDSQSGQAIGVPEFKYGLRVIVIAIACSDLWRDSERSLEIGGLKAFGLENEIKHEQIGHYKQAKSVIDEYNTTS